jgi:hypothetical protein
METHHITLVTTIADVGFKSTSASPLSLLTLNGPHCFSTKNVFPLEYEDHNELMFRKVSAIFVFLQWHFETTLKKKLG